MTDDPNHRALTQAGSKELRAFNDHGILSPADIHVASRVAELVDEQRIPAVLLTALAVRAVREGSVCLDLTTVPTEPNDPLAHEWEVPAEYWPAVNWPELLSSSSLLTCTPAPLKLDGSRLYLARYWQEETRVLEDLLARTSTPRPAALDLTATLNAYFPGEDSADQRHAAALAAQWPVAIITGGPGSGKTTTIARLLGVLYDEDPDLRIGLAAPTGKAAARMVEALDNATRHETFPPEHAQQITGIPATTIHRLLGYSPQRGFRYHRNNPLPYDVVIVDETSMVSLTLMARLLDGLDRAATIIFVGDADQLASVEVGAVFSDLVEGLRGAERSPVAELDRSRRFGEEIHGLAEAVKAGRTADVARMLQPGKGPIATLSADELAEELLPVAQRMFDAANSGDSKEAVRLLGAQQLLCAHRDGPYGASTWNAKIRDLLAARLGRTLEEWYPGMPLLVTKNDYAMRLFNGDSAVVVWKEGRLVAAFEQGSEIREIPLSQLSNIAAAHAITVHRSQGSQFDAVYVLLPERDSRILTRELLYTALTRAQHCVRVTGDTEVVEAAISRPVTRASGLAARLQQARTRHV